MNKEREQFERIIIESLRSRGITFDNIIINWENEGLKPIVSHLITIANLEQLGISNTVPFTKEDILKHIDECITFWRKDKRNFAEFYVDAYQSMRMSIFGELLPLPEE